MFYFAPSPSPCALKSIFIIFFFCLCLSLWFAGAPLHCSSASSTPIEQSPSPPPSPPANESQRRLLGNGVAQPTQDSDSEEEFVPNSFLVKSGSASLGVAANGKSFSLPNFCGLVGFCLSLAMLINLPARELAGAEGPGAWGAQGFFGTWRAPWARTTPFRSCPAAPPGCAGVARGWGGLLFPPP